MRKPLSERFWSKVPLPDSPDGCMEWNGNRDLAGYGMIRKGPASEGTFKAHRVAWELAHGPIPDGMAICHTCDNPPCVRPDHLFVGSLADNNRDMVAKGRHGKAHPSQRGERHHNSKYTVAQVREVRRLRAEGKTYTVIAEVTGVNPIAAGALVSRRTWAWLDAEAA